MERYPAFFSGEQFRYGFARFRKMDAFVAQGGTEGAGGFSEQGSNFDSRCHGSEFRENRTVGFILTVKCLSIAVLSFYAEVELERNAPKTESNHERRKALTHSQAVAPEETTSSKKTTARPE